MIITKVSYSKKFPTGAYLNEDIGFEAEVDSMDDPQEAIGHLKQMAEDAHKRNNPGLYVEERPYTPTHIPGVPDSKEERIQIMINDLNNSTTLKDLESWALLTRTSPLIKEAYDLKYNELSNQKQ